MDCVFCKIVSGQIKAKIISESKKSIAFLDAFPLTKGHTLVIPKSHHSKIQDMSEDENTDLFSLVHALVPKIDSISGSTLVSVHNGKEAGQEIPHVHVHLIPRNNSDGAGAVHTMFKQRPKISEKEFDEILSKIKS
ncbi:MAG: HIT family protein [Candidatus Nitrosotenuis sp.]|jgi:histidine triad (HIT) family protein